MRHCYPIIIILLCFIFACNGNRNKISQCNENSDPSAILLRLSIDHTLSDERWDKVYPTIAAHPNCCDDIWFSSGLGYPAMEVHKKNAEVIKRATEQLKEIGIKSSIQLQMTIGHGDQFNADYSKTYIAKDWSGWTGPNGVVDSCCSCPRQPKFKEYIRQMAGIYAENHPVFCWVDDDLRIDNHQPATNNSYPGCWCDTCIAYFNNANGANWTRESLSKEVGKNPALYDKWITFSISSLTDLVAVITEEFQKISPETRMALQNTQQLDKIPQISAILKTMHEISGHPVGYRSGGGPYYESDQREQIIKSIGSAEMMKYLVDLDFIDTWCPEVETYPRTFESRSAQSIMVEGFTALAYGHNAISCFITSSFLEDQEIHRDYLYKPLSDGADMFRNYIRDNNGTIVAGYEADTDARGKYCIGVTGIPILVGVGKSLGKLTENELSIYAPQVSSKVIQNLRDDLNERMPAPAVCCSPFFGHMIQRVDVDGNLRTIGIINTRIDYQNNIRIRLNNVKDVNALSVVWYELKKEPEMLPIEKEEDRLYVTIPSIFPWSVGYLSIN